MNNSLNSLDHFDQESSSEPINLDQQVSEITQSTQQHSHKMDELKADDAVSKESKMEALMRQLNGEPEKTQNTIESTPYSPKNILSQLSALSQTKGFTNMKHSRSLKDNMGNILSIETKGQNRQQESVGSCFYKSCKCSKFSSKGNYMINEYYDANGNVDRADKPVEYKNVA